VTSRARKAGGVSGGLMLASMLDILMAILFFLLKNYSAVISDFNVGKDISLPQSTAMQPPMPALQLVVTQKEILLDDKPIGRIVNGDIERKDLYRDGVTIVPLAQALNEQKKRSLYIQNHSDNHSFTGKIVMQADKTLQFNVLKKVIYMAGITDFVMLKLAVLKKDQS
jgi:biopolymer transport protein ExbD